MRLRSPQRRIEPEWLDHLPAGDVRAVHSRGDLRRLNSLMFHGALMAATLARHCAAPPRTILDLGAGDGSFMLSVARRLAPRWRDVTVLLLDQHDIVSDRTRQGFAALHWHARPVVADLFGFLEHDQAPPDVVTANLVLHHFPPPELATLLRHVARQTGLFVAYEPHRAMHALAVSRMLWALGCNDVTRHDAPASVRAGFRDDELTALWPASDGWNLSEGRAGVFSHRFIARRR